MLIAHMNGLSLEPVSQSCQRMQREQATFIQIEEMAEETQVGPEDIACTLLVPLACATFIQYNVLR